MKSRDQRLLEEAYCRIYESVAEPLYFGPKEHKQKWMEWIAICSLNLKVNQDGTIDAKGSVDLDRERLLSDPFKSLFPLETLPFQFKTVEKDFDCRHNNLSNLKGSPETVGGSFLCYHNSIESLEGAPKIVQGSFLCYDNRFSSLQGCPEVIGGKFDCSYSNITSLEGGPKIVYGDFDCTQTKLESLNGCPELIEGKFICDQFSDEDYRAAAKRIRRQKERDVTLSRDFDIDVLKDF